MLSFDLLLRSGLVDLIILVEVKVKLLLLFAVDFKAVNWIRLDDVGLRHQVFG